MTSGRQETVLITGASFGIGYDLARLFAEDGYNLVLVARSLKKLEEMAADFRAKHGVRVTVLARDLAQANTPYEIFIELEKAGIPIDILVNNAGFGIHGFFADIPLREDLEMIQLNITTLTHLTKLFLPGMRERKSGRILNVASTAAFQPGPLMAIYYATKAYVLSFSEAIANELKGTGVSVTCLCPGPTYTEFHKRAGLEKVRLWRAGLTMSSESVARIGYRALMKGKPVAIAGLLNWLMAQSVRISPRWIVTKAVRFVQDKRLSE